MSSLLAEADATGGGPYGESPHHESPEPPAVRGGIPLPWTFRSPCHSPKSEETDDISSEESLSSDIQKLKEKWAMLDREISQLVKEGYHVAELENQISLLREYNDVKDVAQMLLGELALTRGVTTKELYPDFGLEPSD
ncbi:hypothetical protein STEG23_028979 [Scotinomys teguina]